MLKNMFIFINLHKYIIKKSKQPHHYVSDINHLQYGFLTECRMHDYVAWTYLNKSKKYTIKIDCSYLSDNDKNMNPGYNHKYYSVDVYVDIYTVFIESAVFYEDTYYIKTYIDHRLKSIEEEDINDDQFQHMLDLCSRRLMVHDYYEI